MSGLKLPFRVVTNAPTEPVLCVDGALGAPGLELSHWPGNSTPNDLRHDLSTGSALAFMELAPAVREQRASGLTAIVNNHVDTDGACALFALLRPEEACTRRTILLDTARAGDFFQLPSERAFAVDQILTHLFSDRDSAWNAEWRELPETERWTQMSLRAVDALPGLLDGDFGVHAEFAHAALDRLEEDRASLAAARRDDLVHFDLAVFTGAPANDAQQFDPGRHALFERDPRDRVLALGTGRAGTNCRFVISTLSWFDVDRDLLPRPDLNRLRQKLQALEDAVQPGDDMGSWHAQPVDSPSPELWFGNAEHKRFAEHASSVLRASRLDADTIRREVIEAVRESYSFDA